tara:strand:+ start:1592 stop:1774 length:183 start_codon:yes stop_codon:yes gene_type:complete
MSFHSFALASSEWGISRFTTDFFALLSLLILIGLPYLLLRNRIQTKSLWTEGNAISNRFE